MKTITKKYLWLVLTTLFVISAFFSLGVIFSADKAKAAEQFSSGQHLDIWYPDRVILNQQYTIRVKTSGIVANRVSIYLIVTGAEEGKYQNISKTNFCSAVAANNPAYKLHGQVTCSAEGVCDGKISNTISQEGHHRVIAAAMRGTELCAPNGSNANDVVITLNYNGIVRGVTSGDSSEDDGSAGAGGSGDDGSGGGTGGINTGDSIDPPAGFGIANFQSSRSIQTIRDLVERVGSFSLMLLGFLAVVGIILAGMKYISSGGDEKKAEAAKKALLFTVYGIIITVVSITLINTTISEVGRLITVRTPTATESDNVDTVLERIKTWGGPNATILDIIGQGGVDPSTGQTRESGMVWRFIKLAALYAQLVAFFYILYASFLYMTSYGDENKAESAKKTLIWALIGLAVIISATTILNIFGEILA
jgi:hypothetical protein